MSIGKQKERRSKDEFFPLRRHRPLGALTVLVAPRTRPSRDRRASLKPPPRSSFLSPSPLSLSRSTLDNDENDEIDENDQVPLPAHPPGALARPPPPPVSHGRQRDPDLHDVAPARAVPAGVVRLLGAARPGGVPGRGRGGGPLGAAAPRAVRLRRGRRWGAAVVAPRPVRGLRRRAAAQTAHRGPGVPGLCGLVVGHAAADDAAADGRQRGERADGPDGERVRELQQYVVFFFLLPS